jgi:hypothetical protein
MKTKIVCCHTADSKPVKQEVNGTVMLPPLVFPALWYWPGGARNCTVFAFWQNIFSFETNKGLFTRLISRRDFALSLLILDNNFFLFV